MSTSNISLEEQCYALAKNPEFLMKFVEFLNGWKKNFDKLLSLEDFMNQYYLPSKKISKAKLISLIELLPTKFFMKEKFEFSDTFFKNLTDSQFCIEIQRERKVYLLLTPEGYSFFDILDLRKGSGKTKGPSLKLARKLQQQILQLLRAPVIERIEKLSKSVEEINLNRKEIGTVLFFLLNGCIGEENEYNTKPSQILRRIPNYTIHAFTAGEGTKLNEDDRREVKIRLFEKDLFYFSNEKLFAGIFNEESRSYIQENKLETIEEITFKSIQTQFKKFEDFKKHWDGFVEELLYFRSTLTETNNFHYTKSRELELLDRIKAKSFTA